MMSHCIYRQDAAMARELVGTIVFVLFCATSMATDYEVNSATPAATINSTIAALGPGDRCLFHGGYYDLRNIWVKNINGTAENWIELAPYDSNIPHIHGNTEAKNTIDVDNVSYVKIRGLEISGGSDGLKFNANTSSHHVTLEDLNVHHPGATGLNSKAEPLHHLIIRGCEVSYTGGHGEGMYLGSPSNPDAIVYDSLIERNYVHHTGGSQGDGIEIKPGSYRNIVQDNVLHDIATVSHAYAAITLYRTKTGNIADNNIIRRNVVWNANEGIFAAAETTIENNVVFNCTYGINTNNHESDGVSNFIIRNNTVYNCSNTCIRLGDWNIGTGTMMFVNNAVLQTTPGAMAIYNPGGKGSATVSNNRHYGTGIAGSVLCSAPAVEFGNATATPGTIDLYPKTGSALIDNGLDLSGVVLDDFNYTARPHPPAGRFDIGAYEWAAGRNPGWQIDEEMKAPPKTAVKHWSRWDPAVTQKKANLEQGMLALD